MPEDDRDPNSRRDSAADLALEARVGTATLDDACAAAERALSREAVEYIERLRTPRGGSNG